jgi:hypothetical protein
VYVPHEPTGAVRDWVFPVVTFAPDPNATHGMAGPTFHGTGFLISGSTGLAFTAKHVADNLEVGLSAGLFVEDGGWRSYAIHEIRDHPTEDVSVIFLEANNWDSPFHLVDEQHHASARYSVWGYPTDVMYERLDDSGIALPSYELVYSEGHVRRRISDVDLPAARGRQFFELSNAAGAGCSGAPVPHSDEPRVCTPCLSATSSASAAAITRERNGSSSGRWICTT